MGKSQHDTSMMERQHAVSCSQKTCLHHQPTISSHAHTTTKHCWFSIYLMSSLPRDSQPRVADVKSEVQRSSPPSTIHNSIAPPEISLIKPERDRATGPLSQEVLTHMEENMLPQLMDSPLGTSCVDHPTSLVPQTHSCTEWNVSSEVREGEQQGPAQGREKSKVVLSSWTAASSSPSTSAREPTPVPVTTGAAAVMSSAHVIICIDISGSMRSEGRMKQTFESVLELMTEQLESASDSTQQMYSLISFDLQAHVDFQCQPLDEDLLHRVKELECKSSNLSVW